MPITVNGTTITKVIVNGVEVDTVVCNGVTVFTSKVSIALANMTHGTDYGGYECYTWLNNTGRNLSMSYTIASGGGKNIYLILDAPNTTTSSGQVFYGKDQTFKGTVTVKAGYTIRIRLDDGAKVNSASFTEA